MYLYCPRCKARLSISDDKIPLNGAWAKCPKCSERFFINPKVDELDVSNHLKEQASTPKSQQRSQAAQKLLNRLKKQNDKAETSADSDDDAYNVITVYPKAAGTLFPYYALIAIITGGILILMLYLFRSSSVDNNIQVQDAPQTPKYTYENDGLINDLIALRKDTNKYQTVNWYIDYSGRESRFFKYILQKTAKDMCQEISDLRLSSSQTSEGFEMSATCVDKAKPSPQVSVSWEDGKALIQTNGGSNLVVDLDKNKSDR